MSKLADYLDSLVNGHHAQTGKYPSSILMGKQDHERLKAELGDEALDNSWLQHATPNYKGIPIDLVEFEGEQEIVLFGGESDGQDKGMVHEQGTGALPVTVEPC